MNELTFTLRNIPLKSDSGWKYSASARPKRGLHDYERVIIFERELLPDEEKRLEEAILLLDNPGYCRWSFRSNHPGAYYLTSTMDSSD